MAWQIDQLKTSGYEIVWLSGLYCRACRENSEVLLRWSGTHWSMM